MARCTLSTTLARRPPPGWRAAKTRRPKSRSIGTRKSSEASCQAVLVRQLPQGREFPQGAVLLLLAVPQRHEVARSLGRRRPGLDGGPDPGTEEKPPPLLRLKGIHDG